MRIDAVSYDAVIMTSAPRMLQFLIVSFTPFDRIAAAAAVLTMPIDESV